MDYYEIISCVIATAAVVVSGTAALFTYKNLREIRNQFFEQNRGNLVFYINKIKRGDWHTLILKNYGNSPAKLLSLTVNPEIDWSKTEWDIPDDSKITNCKNVFIAPKQFISSDFSFSNYPDNIFEVTISYKTCGKVISDTYVIDLSFTSYLVDAKITSSNELKALDAISENIQQLSERFL